LPAFQFAKEGRTGEVAPAVRLRCSSYGHAKEEPLDEEEDVAGGYIEKSDCLDIFGGIDDITDEDLFDEEVVDEGNIFN
jgi:hypothetical protein